jgi:Mrp family chromosome partitioning ATPase
MVVEKAVRMVKMMNKPLVGLVENMSGAICPHCGERFEVLGESQGEALAAKHDMPWLGPIPIDPALAKSAEGRIEEYTSPAVETVDKIADAIMALPRND